MLIGRRLCKKLLIDVITNKLFKKTDTGVRLITKFIWK